MRAKKHIVVYGASGFIGKHLTKYLKKKGYGVEPVNRGTEDITIPNSIKAITKGDIVINLVGILPKEAEKNPYKTFMVNTIGTLNIIKRAIEKKAKKIILASSLQALQPNNIYGLSKLFAEKICEYYDEIPIVVLRYPPVYGPFRDTGCMATFCKNLLNNKKSVVFNESSDFIYVKDVCRINELALKLKSGIYNACFGKKIPIPYVYQLISTQLKKNIKPIIKSRTQIDWTQFGWRTNIKAFKLKWSIERGVKETVEWWKRSETQKKI